MNMLLIPLFISIVLICCFVTFALSYRKGYIKGVSEVTLQWQENNDEIKKSLEEILHDPFAEEVRPDEQEDEGAHVLR